ncbi:MAG: phospho-sugar mutase, partial [Flavobacteriaceae bacterium]|nr:phospho-sugar mutase [Flavobacteriaceae bacterium]
MEKNLILEKARQWLDTPFDSSTQNEIQQLITNESEELTDRFYKNLEFGTGGIRGIMGAGTNRINKYTLGKATQGLSNYLLKTFPGKELKAVIAYDCRHNSKEFAQIVANIFSANSIKAYLFDDLRPTPELSFAVRHLGCDVGIVLTASHNPPEYNGYKVYWNDGGQIVPPEDHEIINEVNNVDFSQINFNANKSLIEKIGKKIDKEFVNASVENGTFGVPNKDKLT